MKTLSAFNPLLKKNLQDLTMPSLTYFATVAEAQLGIPTSECDVCYVAEKEALYKYCTGCTFAADADLVLITGNGGDTRWELMQKVSRTQGDIGWIVRSGLTVSKLSTTEIRVTVAATICQYAIKSVRYDLPIGNYDKTITGTPGIKYCYFDEAGALQFEGTTDFMSRCYVAAVFWTGTAIGGIQTEFHGIRDTVWHAWAHKYLGTQYTNGLQITTNTQPDSGTDPGADDTVQFLWLTPGVIHDEDTEIDINTSGQWTAVLGTDLTSATAAQIPFFYYNGTNVVGTAANATREPFLFTGANGLPQRESAGVLTAATSGEYVVYHYFASPFIDGFTIFARPHNNTTRFTSLTVAQSARPASLVWSAIGEWKHIYTVIFRCGSWGNTPTHNCKIVSVQDFRNVSSGPASATNASSHAALSGLADAGAHPASAISADATGFDKILSATDTDVQTALSTIDETAAKKAASSTDNAFARFDTTTGQLLQNSVVTATDTGEVDSTSTGYSKLASGTTAQRPTATAGRTRFNSDVARWEVADGSVFRAVAQEQDRSITNYVKHTEFDTATGSAPAGWSGTATITTTRTAADLPRELTSGVGVSIVMTAGQIGTWAFTLDDVDLNRVLQAVCDANVKSGTDILMTVKDGSTVLGSVTLLSGFSSPRFDFVTASNAALTLNFSSAAGGTVVISDTSVSAGKLVSGPQVGGWTSFTPTGSWVANTTYTGMWRAVGNSIEVLVKVLCSGAPTAAGLTVNLPSGFTIQSGTSIQSIGDAVSVDAEVRAYPGTVAYVSSTSVNVTHAASSPGFVSDTAPITFGNGDYVGLHFTVPVNELSVSAYYGHEGVEFASNNGPTWDAVNTTDFTVNTLSPQGSLVGGTLAAGREKRVRFQSAIQPTDLISLEVSKDRINWITLTGVDAGLGVHQLQIQNGVSYGMSLRALTGATATDISVNFGQYMYSSGITYASAGTNWPGSALYWRVRKASSPSLAGHNVATTAQPTGLYKAGAAPGVVGSAPITGAIGEMLTTTTSAALSISTSATTILSLSVPTGGRYSCSAGCYPRASLTGFRMWVDTSASSEPTVASRNYNRWQTMQDGDNLRADGVILDVPLGGGTIYLRTITTSGTAANAGAFIQIVRCG